MLRAKKINIISLILNLAIVGLVIGAIGLLFVNFGLDKGSLKYYKNIAALVTGLASLLMIIPNVIGIVKKRNATPRLFFTLRFISAVMSTITLITVLAVLVPEYGVQSMLLNVSDGTIFFHLIIPALSVLTFIFVDIMPSAKFSKTFGPFVVTLIYAIVMFLLIFLILKTKGVNAAQEFVSDRRYMWIFREMDPERFILNIVVSVILLIGSYIVSVVVWGLNRISSYLIVGVSYNGEESISSDDIEPTKFSERVKKYIKKSVSFKGENNETTDKIYHISYHNRHKKTWKVKGEGALRANKVFATQKEAIDFANDLVAKNGGSIRVHSMVGKIRKE